MKFLYSDNGRGLFSSMAGSCIFWVVVILVVVLIVVIIMGKGKKEVKTSELKAEEEKFPTDVEDSENQHYRTTIDSLSQELRMENERMENMFNGVTPDLQKTLDGSLPDDVDTTAQLIGVSDDKNVKLFYHTSAKKENIYRIWDSSLEAVDFKLELRDLTKVSSPTGDSEVRLFNQNRKCIAIFKIDLKSINIRCNSPYFDDVKLDLEDNVRLLAFHQISNKLFLDSRQIAAFDIYDKITYFVVKSPLVKELQYSVKEVKP